MEASLSFQAGKPFLSDEEYDELKQKLQKKNSKVVQQVILRLNPCVTSTGTAPTSAINVTLRLLLRSDFQDSILHQLNGTAWIAEFQSMSLHKRS